MTDKTIVYCDRCAEANGLPVEPKKHVKSTCQICNRFVGPLNETIEESVIPNNVPSDEIKVGSFKVQQMPNFLQKMIPSNIHPTLPYEIKSQDLVLYYPSIDDDEKGRKTLIIANPKMGEQIKVILPGNRKTINVGSIDAE